MTKLKLDSIDIMELLFALNMFRGCKNLGCREEKTIINRIRNTRGEKRPR